MRRATSFRRSVVVVVGALCVGGLVSPAVAATPSVGAVKVTGATHTSLTFTVTGNASKFTVYVAQVHHQLIADLLHNDPHGSSSSHTVTVTGLKYSTTPYYWRAVAESGGRRAYSATFGPRGLKPSAPTGLAVSNPDGGLSLSWTGGPGTGYVVDRATNSSFSSGKQSYTLLGPGQQFTPGDLTKGTSYFFRVRAVNTGTKSKPSNTVSGSRSADGTSITAMTWNIKELDSPHPSDETWSDRKPKIVKVINDVHPNVIAIQEAAAWVGAVKGPREVDDLVDALGGSYRLARTEIPPTEKHYFRTADYLIYDSNVLQTVGNGDHWDIGHGAITKDHWAAYQQFRVTSTGAKFIYVSFHLYVKNNNPASDDQVRQDQTESMLSQGEAYASSHGAPIFYAGDTNSAVEDKHQFDGPRVAFQAHHVADAFGVAQSRSGAKYDTANQFQRKPPTHHKYLDGIFLAPGLAATTWSQVLELTNGRFVGAIPSDHNPLVATVVVPT